MLALGAKVEEQPAIGRRGPREARRRLAARSHRRGHRNRPLEVEIEEECLKILALYQPVAGDLRFVVAILKINNDLERIGDLAVNIAERAMELAEAPPVPIPAGTAG